MQEAWDTTKPEWVVWIATRQGVLTDRELRLFAVWLARQTKPEDLRSTDAIDVAERFAVGGATREELCVASSAAHDAARRTTDSLAARAARAAAWTAAIATRENARGAAWDASEAARDASEAAAWSAQAQWLRDNT